VDNVQNNVPHMGVGCYLMDGKCLLLEVKILGGILAEIN
jgi:hypothetical protein